MAGNTAEKTTKVIRYTGVAATATISKSDWAKAGVDNQDKVEWTKGSEVPESDLSKEALAVLAKDGRFQQAEAKPKAD